MNIYFTAPIKGIEPIEPHLRQIHKLIQTLGYSHIDNYLERLNNGKKFYDNLDKGGKEAHDRYFTETMDSLINADINIFECSIPSLGVGFQVEKSLTYNKPTVILYYTNHVPHFLVAGTVNEHLLIREYNEKNIADVLQEVIEQAKQISDKRFNFFISPSLLGFLDEESSKRGITKSAFIRQLILEDRKKKTK